jgi:hypothetical protein
LQEAIKNRTLWVIRRLAGQSVGVSGQAVGGSTRQITEAARKVREASPLMQTAVGLNQERFAFKTCLLICRVVYCVNPIDDFPAIPNDLANDVALEGISFPDWMISARLGFMFKHTPI